MRELRAQLVANRAQQVELDVSKPNLTGALQDLRLQSENLASSNMQKTEGWYRCQVRCGISLPAGGATGRHLTLLCDSSWLQFSCLKEVAGRSGEALRQVTQETHEYQRQVRVLTSDLEALRRAVSQ